MPNRILKESICTSENLDNLGNDAEVLFYRLIVQCDDFGRMDARLPVIRARCFPLKIDYLTDGDIAGWLTSLIEAELLFVYMVEDRPYLQITTWEKHQQVRAKNSKFPSPPDGCDRLISSEIIGNQLQADDSNCPRIRNRIRNPKRNREGTGVPTPAPVSDKEKPKKVYGEHQNVKLTEDDLVKLREKFGDEGAEQRIQKLSLGKAAKGYKYTSDYAAILKWEQRDGEDSQGRARAGPPKPATLKKIDEGPIEGLEIEH